MEKARFVIEGSPAAVADAISQLLKDDRFSPLAFDPRDEKVQATSLVHMLHPTARDRLQKALGEKSASLPALPDMIDKPRSEFGIAEFVAAIGDANPFRFQVTDGKGDGKVLDGIVPESILIPLMADPAAAGLAPRGRGTRVFEPSDAPIAFHDDGGPGQQHRAPATHGVTFLRRAEAMRAVGFTPGLSRTVKLHVFVVDQGMDSDFVDAQAGMSGTVVTTLWHATAPAKGHLPLEHLHRYRSLPQWHAHMIVRNILSVAGDNRNLKPTNPGKEEPILFYDVPIIPDRVDDVHTVATRIGQQYDMIEDAIGLLVSANDRVLIVNAWGIKDRMREQPVDDGTGKMIRLTEDPDHPLNQKIDAIRQIPGKKVEIVFAAGNSGLFTPDPQAGPLDRGPNRSIWLPAALPDVSGHGSVWSVGATDANGMWIGGSSQGPSTAKVSSAAAQPDFNTPSYFREDLDAHVLNTGTSASCGMMAGLMAASLRDNPSNLNKGASATNGKKQGHIGQSGRFGRATPQHNNLR